MQQEVLSCSDPCRCRCPAKLISHLGVNLFPLPAPRSNALPASLLIRGRRLVISLDPSGSTGTLLRFQLFKPVERVRPPLVCLSVVTRDDSGRVRRPRPRQASSTGSDSSILPCGAIKGPPPLVWIHLSPVSSQQPADVTNEAQGECADPSVTRSNPHNS